MQENIKRAVAAAEADWEANTGEHDRKPGSGLDKIFIESTWNRFGVPREKDAKIPDWCGMAVVAWLWRAGFNALMRSSFFHTFNLAAFFTYGRVLNVNPGRLDVWVQLNGDTALTSIEEWHQKSNAPRRWVDRPAVLSRLTDSIASGKPDADLFAPGDVVLIDWSRRDDPDHITMVRGWDGRTLELIEGNASGVGPDGKRRTDAVIVRRLDMHVVRNSALIFGVGRLSPLDFGNHTVREWRKGDPAIKRGA
jgi:hypothetical protein